MQNMFDTHAHLNFSRFKKNVPDVIQRAHDTGVTHIVIPGTDVTSSQKAIEITEQHEGMYAAAGIHPHHVFQYVSEVSDVSFPRRRESIDRSRITSGMTNDLSELRKLLSHPKVVAVGEIGIDRHQYEQTKYTQYSVNEQFVSIQQKLFNEQIKLSIKYKKSLIIHNREATDDVLEILQRQWSRQLSGRAVFHCSEANEKILSFAKEHQMFIGVDGDITYDTHKQEFIKRVPLDMLVLETDSPFLLPEPLRSRKEFPNEPKNIAVIAECIATITGASLEEIQKKTTENAKCLFNV